jgi:site-specific DNA-cytosine methylase
VSSYADGDKYKRIGSLFSGCGGLDHGVERSGLGRVAWQCEAIPFRRQILAVRYPGTPCYEDVCAIASDPAALPPVDVLVGGFPCQDVSLAGKAAGLAGARSGLWFRYLELVRALKPRGVLIENVPGLLSRGIEVVVAGLTDAGYAVEATRLQAADLGAPHERERVFIVAVRADVAGELGGEDEYGGAWTPLPAGEVRRWPTWEASARWPTWEASARWPTWEASARWPTPTRPGGTNSQNGSRVRPQLAGAVREAAQWPTVRASDGSSPGASSSPSLRTAVRDDTRTWPTPTVKGNYNHVGAGERSGDGLATVARRWATPMRRDWKSTSPAITAGNTRPLSEQVGEEARRGVGVGREVVVEPPCATVGPDPGPLSPLWTEALQGLPLGWTDLAVPNEMLLEAPDWPRERGPEQHDWEPPRTVPARSVPERGERIEALGDAVVPACAEVAGRRLRAHLEGRVKGAPQLGLFAEKQARQQDRPLDGVTAEGHSAETRARVPERSRSFRP